MDPPEPSRHGRRALPLIAGSLAAMVVAGVIYLHPAFPSLPKGPAAPLPPIPSTVPAEYFPQYAFISATTGWALLFGTPPSTRSYVYRTTDGAKHWNLQLDLAGAGFGDIKFFDSKRGMVWIGFPIQLYRTSDAGSHWSPVSLPPYQADEVTYSDPSHIWLLASEPDPGLLRHFFATSDGGNAWTELAWPKGAVWANKLAVGHLQFRQPGEGWLATAEGSEPAVYSTADGGASWERHALPRPSGLDNAVDTYVSLLPGAGVIAYIDFGPPMDLIQYTSFDGGTTWSLVTHPPNAPAQDISFQDSSHWWAAGSGTLWKSSDAGRSWKFVYQEPNSWVFQPRFIDMKHGWAELIVLQVWPPGGLAMTSDGGLHWTQVNAPGPS